MDDKKKLKVYLDSSVPSHLQTFDRPDWMRDTLLFWEILKNGKYQIFLSDIVMKEIYRCHEPKLGFMINELNKIQFTVISLNEEIERLASIFVKLKILRAQDIDDCLHLASAMYSECDILVSWNFSHMVTHTTIEGVKVISKTEGYKEISIYCPSILIGDKNETELKNK